jgi:hypothetical protein
MTRDPKGNVEQPVSSDGVEAEEALPVVGGLDFDQYICGGLGRHLGTFLTIFLM